MSSNAALRLKRFELILLVVGVKCLLLWSALRVYSFASSRAAVQSFEAIDEGETVAYANSPPVDVTLWSNERIVAYQRSLFERTGTPIAVLRIPKIGLSAPVFNGTDGWTLNRGVGRVPGTAKIGVLGNLAIAGHRDGFFRELSQLIPGDIVELDHLGNVERYTVTETRVVRPEDISVLSPSASARLTLITCFPFHFIGHAPQRYIVTAAINAQGVTLAGRNSLMTSHVKQQVNE